MEDTVIINLYFDRSEKAIQATEEKYSRYCFSIAWNVLYDKEDSDECVNDTWLATWNSIPPRKPAILSAFLGKITRNLAIDCFRRKKAAKRSTEHILELCKELEEIEDLTAYSLNDEIQRKEILEILYDATGIWTASAKFQPVMEFQKAESNPASIEAEKNYGKG